MAYAFERGYGKGTAAAWKNGTKAATGLGWGAFVRAAGVRLAPESKLWGFSTRPVTRPTQKPAPRPALLFVRRHTATLTGYPVGPGKAAAPRSNSVNHSDYTQLMLSDYDRLGVAPIVAAGAAQATTSIVGAIKKDTTAQRQAEAAAAEARARAGDQSAVGLLYYRMEVNNFVDPRHGYAGAIERLIQGGYLNPTTRRLQQPSGIVPGNVVGPSAATAGGGGGEIITDVFKAFFETDVGRDVKKAAVAGAVEQQKEEAGRVIGQNIVPIALGVGALLFLAMRR